MSSAVLEFDLENKIPLVETEQYSLQALQDHSTKLDIHFGFDFIRCEANVEYNLPHENKSFRTKFDQEYWQGTDPQIFQTPYCELRWIVHKLGSIEPTVIADMGCGYARLAHVLEMHFPSLKYFGLEFSNDRIQEAERVYQACYSKKLNILKFDLNSPLVEFQKIETLRYANYFFVYDFGSAKAVRNCIHNLKYYANFKPISLIARGKLIHHEILSHHPWLWTIRSPQHFKNFSVFYSG